VKCYIQNYSLLFLSELIITSPMGVIAFLLSLPRGRLVTSLLKFGTTYPSISGFALPYQPSNVTSKCTYLSSILHFTPAILLTQRLPARQIQYVCWHCARYKCSYYYYYCDEYVCLSVGIFPEPHMQSLPNFLCMLPMSEYFMVAINSTIFIMMHHAVSHKMIFAVLDVWFGF